MITNKYHRFVLFHGDIKPENIFFSYKEYDICTTSDIGSLLYLGIEEDDKFIVTCYTEKYASAQHIEAVKNKTPLTRE